MLWHFYTLHFLINTLLLGLLARLLVIISIRSPLPHFLSLKHANISFESVTAIAYVTKDFFSFFPNKIIKLLPPKKWRGRNENSLLGVKLGFNNTSWRLSKRVFLASYSTEIIFANAKKIIYLPNQMNTFKSLPRFTCLWGHWQSNHFFFFF